MYSDTRSQKESTCKILVNHVGIHFLVLSLRVNVCSINTRFDMQMYGGSQADLSDHVDEMGVSPKGEHGLGLSQEEEEDKGIVQDEETEVPLFRSPFDLICTRLL